MKNTKKTHAQRTDGTLSPEDFAKAIEQYKARRAQRIAEKQADSEPAVEPVVKEEPVAEAVSQDEINTNPNAGGALPVKDPVGDSEEEHTPEEMVQMAKDRRDRRDEEGDPANMEAAQGMIAQQDEDISILFDIIDTLLAEKEFSKADSEPANDETSVNPAVVQDEDDEEEPVIGAAVDNADPETEEETNTDEDEELAEDEADDEESKMNADSVDAIVRERIKIGMVGRKVNLDGLELMDSIKARKAIIQAVRPGLRLDGKSNAYIKAAYDMAVADIESGSQKDTGYQKRQMFNKDGRNGDNRGYSAMDARQRMIDRQNKKED